MNRSEILVNILIDTFLKTQAFMFYFLKVLCYLFTRIFNYILEIFCTYYLGTSFQGIKCVYNLLLKIKYFIL